MLGTSFQKVLPDQPCDLENGVDLQGLFEQLAEDVAARIEAVADRHDRSLSTNRRLRRNVRGPGEFMTCSMCCPRLAPAYSILHPHTLISDVIGRPAMPQSSKLCRGRAFGLRDFLPISNICENRVQTGASRRCTQNSSMIYHGITHQKSSADADR